jgi:hypothetical protein
VFGVWAFVVRAVGCRVGWLVRHWVCLSTDEGWMIGWSR